jgi:hypothetical protein
LLACLLVFALVLKASYGMAEASAYLLPRVVALAGLVVTSIELAVCYSKPRAATQQASETKGLHVLASIGFTAVYFSVVPLLGFLLATALAIAAFGYLTRFPRKKLVAVLAVVVPIVLHVTFGELLKAPLPAGVLGGLRF